MGSTSELYRRPEAPVLIVEGEKAADAAQELFKGYVVISWLGGTYSASKADWKHLTGKQVVVWPDNDSAGFKASEEVCKELRGVGVKSLKVVDREILQRSLPKKWDLADELPKNLPKSFTKDTILNSKDVCVSIDSILKGLSMDQDQFSSSNFRALVAEILAKVDARMRPILEKTLGQKTWEINNEIAKEVVNIWTSKESISKKLNEMGIKGEVNERLTSLSLYSKAEKGVEFTLGEVENFRKTLQVCGNISGNKSQILAFERSLASLSNEGKLLVNDKKLLREVFEREAKKLDSEGASPQPLHQIRREHSISSHLER